MEYGTASAVALWTDQGKDIRYLGVTRGEAGIATMPPEQAGSAREHEQRRSCATVGVSVVEFLDHRDGLVQESLELRRDLAEAIRRHQPEAVLSINHRQLGWPSWNHADHRAVGRALLDAVRDAAILGSFQTPARRGRECASRRSTPHRSRLTPSTSPDTSTAASNRCFVTSDLANLGGSRVRMRRDLRSNASVGSRFGVQHAVAFELVAF
jgi:LmbE family N-acetylglucosaminyl deacetylase